VEVLNMDWRDYIEQRPDVMLGKPVVKGTRLTVELILEELAEGATEAAIIEAHPRLRHEDIHAALVFAAASLDLPEDGSCGVASPVN
jgi:uncharacterized protein (DUF433 family)